MTAATSQGAAREALVVWLAVLAGLAAIQVAGLAVPILHQLLAAAAVAAFLWAPLRMLERRGQDAHDAGWRFDRLGPDIAYALMACVVILPPFAFAFSWFGGALGSLPPSQARLLAPYLGRAHPLRFTFGPDPLDTWGRIAGNAAVAFAEEFFYRGYVTLRLEERWPPARRILGAPLGLGAVLAAALFAVGHLLEPAPWRLFVFFPALIFAWLRARTHTIVGAAICHFLFNVTLLLLELAAFA
jgi:membrane protease YdiL (CAAX protease family)